MGRKRTRRARGGNAYADIQPSYGTHDGRRKVSQLCHQVREALSLGLSSSADVALQELSVVSVAPAPDTSRLLVTVVPDTAEVNHTPAADLDADLDADLNRREAVLQKLENARGYLRSEVASAIHRKRTPDLVFRVIGPHARPPTR